MSERKKERAGPRAPPGALCRLALPAYQVGTYLYPPHTPSLALARRDWLSHMLPDRFNKRAAVGKGKEMASQVCMPMHKGKKNSIRINGVAHGPSCKKRLYNF